MTDYRDSGLHEKDWQPPASSGEKEEQDVKEMPKTFIGPTKTKDDIIGDLRRRIGLLEDRVSYIEKLMKIDQ